MVDGGFVGSTGQAQTAETPDFVVDANVYAIPPDFLPSSATEVTC